MKKYHISYLQESYLKDKNTERMKVNEQKICLAGDNQKKTDVTM